MMDSAVTFIMLLGCWTVWSSPRGQSVSFSMAFSGGTYLLVAVNQDTAVCDKDDEPSPHHNHSKGPSIGPSLLILSSVRLAQDPDSPPMLVCLLNGLNSSQQRVMWWLDGTQMVSSTGPWAEAEGGYSATLVWEVSAADWRNTSSYWCRTIQEGRVYEQKLCSED